VAQRGLRIAWSPLTRRRLRAAQAQSTAPASTASGKNLPWSFEALLRELVDEQTYPRLHRIAWSKAIGGNPSGFDEKAEFAFGVDRILDGVQVLIDKG
jgi:hypothetical protein